MRDRRLARCLLHAAVLLALAAGCQVIQSNRPVSVVALDAETKKPIAGAEVRISYPLTPAYRAPAESSGTTGEDGTARLQAGPADEGLAVDATAAGYLAEQKSVTADAIPATEPLSPFAAPAPHAAPVVVELYAGPGPTIELVLPPGYRGLVKVEIRPRDDIACPPGQRRFRYEVPPSGDVQAVGPALLRRSPDVVARYADGASLNTQPKDGEIGFLWVKSDSGREFYVVGTTIEREALRRTDLKDDASQADGGQKTEHGRGGRRRGQPPADSDTPNP